MIGESERHRRQIASLEAAVVPARSLRAQLESMADGEALVRDAASATGMAAASLAAAGRTVAAISSEYEASAADDILLCNGTFPVVLWTPDVGDSLTVVNVGTGLVTVQPVGGALISGAASLPLEFQWTAYTLVSDGTDWVIV